MSLHVDDLTVHYQTLAGRAEALCGATFSIEDGEIMGLAGESGCGKTTLGRSLITLAKPMVHVGGSVELDGRPLPIADTKQMDEFRFREVSVIPQYAMSAMNPTRRIGRMTAELLKARGVSYRSILPELEQRLDIVGLPTSVLDMYPIELSGGMKQRMVMVLSTLLDPSLLIADEVTSALDVSSQRAVAEMLVDFRDREIVKSIILITHDIAVLAQIADTIMIMYAGHLAEKAPTSTLIESPRHPYTRMLLGALPQVGARHSVERLSGIPGRPPLLIDPPQGCRFRARCPLATDACLETPPFAEIADGHEVACWHHDRIEEMELPDVSTSTAGLSGAAVTDTVAHDTVDTEV